MNEITYQTQVRRRRGKWRVSVPALPADAPIITTDKLANVAPALILEIAEYLGVNPSLISVDVRTPAKTRRRGLRARLTTTAVQAYGGLGALAGVYLAAGSAATLIAAGATAVALGTLRELGKV